MGRNWETLNLSGKMGIGQDSEDIINYFGMEIDNVDVCGVVLKMEGTRDNIWDVFRKVTEFYDELQVPYQEREYVFKEITRFGDFCRNVEKYSEGSPRYYLSECRLEQGLAILSDLIFEGHCRMDIEY